jgi:hypothetical protein
MPDGKKTPCENCRKARKALMQGDIATMRREIRLKRIRAQAIRRAKTRV